MARGSETKRLLVLLSCLALGAFAGCGGMFTAPYDIGQPAPDAEKTPSDLVPNAVDGVAAGEPQTTTHTGMYSGTSVTTAYDNGATLTIAKLKDAGQASKRLDQFYEDEIEGGSKTKVGMGSGAWARGTGAGYFAFAWTNANWVFIVEAASQADAEKIILATGMATKRAEAE